MAQVSILESRSPGLSGETRLWLARAAQARRIAIMLSREDAEIALAHAAECEARAASVVERPVPVAA